MAKIKSGVRRRSPRAGSGSSWFSGARNVARDIAAAAAVYNEGKKIGKELYDNLWAGVPNKYTPAAYSPMPPKMSSKRPIRAYKKAKRAQVYLRGQIGKRFKKGSKKAAAYMAKFGTLGVTRSFEYNGTSTTTNQCIYIGHSTCPTNVVRQSIDFAIVKKLLMKAELLRNSPTGGLGLQGYAMVIYYTDNDDATPGLSFQYNINNLDTLSDLASQLSPFDGSVPTFPGRKMQYIELIQTIGEGQNVVVCRLSLLNAKIRFHISSKLKIQNRTQAAGTDANQTTTITANPLIGKSYDGSGTGTNYMVKTNAAGVGGQRQFFVHNENGVLDFAPIDNDLQEPPYGKAFDKVKAMNGYSIAPGEIKTSYLKHASTMPLYKAFALLRSVNRDGVGTATVHPQVEFGKFRFMALEKIIDPVETEPDITVGFEHQFNIGVYLVAGRDTFTTNFHQTGWKN